MGCATQLPHTNVSTHPKVLPPYNMDISGCYLSRFLYLPEEYQMRVQAGTSLGEEAEVHWGIF